MCTGRRGAGAGAGGQAHLAPGQVATLVRGEGQLGGGPAAGRRPGGAAGRYLPVVQAVRDEAPVILLGCTHARALLSRPDPACSLPGRARQRSAAGQRWTRAPTRIGPAHRTLVAVGCAGRCRVSLAARGLWQLPGGSGGRLNESGRGQRLTAWRGCSLNQAGSAYVLPMLLAVESVLQLADEPAGGMAALQAAHGTQAPRQQLDTSRFAGCPRTPATPRSRAQTRPGG